MCILAWKVRHSSCLWPILIHWIWFEDWHRGCWLRHWEWWPSQSVYSLRRKYSLDLKRYSKLLENSSKWRVEPSGNDMYIWCNICYSKSLSKVLWRMDMITPAGFWRGCGIQFICVCLPRVLNLFLMLWYVPSFTFYLRQWQFSFSACIFVLSIGVICVDVVFHCWGIWETWLAGWLDIKL